MKVKPTNILGVTLALAVMFVAALLIAPSLAAVLGRLIGGLWVTVMSAIAGLLGGMFGG